MYTKMNIVSSFQEKAAQEAPTVPMMAAPEPQEPGKGKVELEDHVTLELDLSW